jgi:hypothetical protein
VARGREAVRGTPYELSPLLGDVLCVLAGALFLADEDTAGRENAAAVRAIAAADPDRSVDLLAELSDLLSETGRAAAAHVEERATDVFARATAAGNSFVTWMASEAAVYAALADGNVERGMRWSDRMVAQHRTMRVREGPSLLELRADLLALAGDAVTAVRLYAAARAHHRRAGMQWPSREVTRQLVAQAAGALDRVQYEEAWQEGARLTVDDLGIAVAAEAPLRGG